MKRVGCLMVLKLSSAGVAYGMFKEAIKAPCGGILT